MGLGHRSAACLRTHVNFSTNRTFAFKKITKMTFAFNSLAHFGHTFINQRYSNITHMIYAQNLKKYI